MIEYNFYAVTRVNNDMTSYNDKNDAVANKNAGGGAETCTVCHYHWPNRKTIY